ncbi:neutrophil cytosol factor 1 isoform X2 [Genypterus blacodes]|uniref:neutrophil cytosol factor 1 isoform X2 n=1 Tax=Genypterus blacodes TaxID=154954 RepID=UPI003F76857F
MVGRRSRETPGCCYGDSKPQWWITEPRATLLRAAEQSDMGLFALVYMLMVKWSDLTEKLVYRTYPEIHTFHKSLKEMFPIEAGQIERTDRIIPSLPAPRWLDSERSTERRQVTLTDYFLALIDLPPHISRCSLHCSFFRVRPEDENPPAPNPTKRNETYVASREKARGNVSDISGPIILDSYRVIADFSKTSKHEIDLQGGELVEIVEKNLNGWWFCQAEARRGWVPASYLEPLDGPEEAEDAEPNYEGEQYITIGAYEAEQEDEMSLNLGETIEVIHKLLDGWWVIRELTGRRRVRQRGRSCRDANRPPAAPPSETLAASTVGLAAASARKLTAGTAGDSSSRNAAVDWANHRRPPRPP